LSSALSTRCLQSSALSGRRRPVLSHRRIVQSRLSIINKMLTKAFCMVNRKGINNAPAVQRRTGMRVVRRPGRRVRLTSVAAAAITLAAVRTPGPRRAAEQGPEERAICWFPTNLASQLCGMPAIGPVRTIEQDRRR
jgi:hypothetical protein